MGQKNLPLKSNVSAQCKIVETIKFNNEITSLDNKEQVKILYALSTQSFVVRYLL